MGENSVGKSTLIKILVSICRPKEGTVIYEGQNVDFKTPHESQMAGISVVHQESKLSETLSMGKKQMVEICKALNHDCRLLIMDELSATLTDKVGIFAVLTAPHIANRSEKFKKQLEARLDKENIKYVYDQDFGQIRESTTNIVTNNISKSADIIWAAVDNVAFGAKVVPETSSNVA